MDSAMPVGGRLFPFGMMYAPCEEFTSCSNTELVDKNEQHCEIQESLNIS